MCGLAGFLDPRVPSEHEARALLQPMLDAIRHRGPDDAGDWLAEGVALGHRRLSIVELSPLGHQPMISRSGRYVLVYNGEIYNHGTLRAALVARGQAFRGHSDTEVLLALIESVGLHAALAQCTGMFALALWDRETATLQLARDRLGEKPLYWGWCNRRLLFASEIKALRAHPAFDATVDVRAAAALLQYGYVPAPRSIHAAVRKVAPGSIVTVRCTRREGRLELPAPDLVEIMQWWSPTQLLQPGNATAQHDDFADASRALEALLADAVRQQMQADVPLGAFLSGGVDSSIVVALMQRQASQPVRSFAIGFDEQGMDEAPHAAAVAKHLGTQHTTLYVSSADALAVVPRLPAMYDEPLGDASQIPTFLVAQMARRDVTVALSGDGGDELFGGYRKYRLGMRLARWSRQRWPAWLLTLLPWAHLEAAERRHAHGGSLRVPRARTALHLLSADGHAVLAARLSEANREAAALLAGRSSAPSLVPAGGLPRGCGYLRTAMWLDSLHYLPDDVLVKVDRATMAVSLESRAPLLDHRIAEFAAGLPPAWLFDAQGGKRILRDVLYRHVPRTLVDRPKQGFSVPLGRWLRTELRDWAGDLLQDSPNSTGLLNLAAGRALFDEHLQGRRDASVQLWPLLSLAAWLRSAADGGAA